VLAAGDLLFTDLEKRAGLVAAVLISLKTPTNVVSPSLLTA
jgi:hypothetical protein